MTTAEHDAAERAAEKVTEALEAWPKSQLYMYVMVAIQEDDPDKLREIDGVLMDAIPAGVLASLVETLMTDEEKKELVNDDKPA